MGNSMKSFLATHRLQLGVGKEKRYWKVRAIPIGLRKSDGMVMYTCLTHPRNRSGVHLIQMVPENRLTVL